MAMRPKVGEKRQLRLPLKIDRLPQKLRDRIVAAREQEFKGWEEIEQESPRWPEWKEVDDKTAALFPGRRLPHSNLARFYDLRIEQVRRQVESESRGAREFARAFGDRELKDLGDAAINALQDQVFAVMSAASDDKTRKVFRAELGNLVFLISKLKAAQVQEQKLELEKDKIEIARQKLDAMKAKLGTLKNDVAKKKVSPEDLQKRLDELYGIA